MAKKRKAEASKADPLYTRRTRSKTRGKLAENKVLILTPTPTPTSTVDNLDAILNKLCPNSANGPRGTLAKYTECIEALSAVTKDLWEQANESGSVSTCDTAVQDILEKLKDPHLSNHLKDLLGKRDYQSLMNIESVDEIHTMAKIQMQLIMVKIQMQYLNPLRKIEKALETVRNTLKEWATYSNGTETQTRTQTTNQKSMNDEVNEQDWKDLNAGVHVASPTVGQSAMDNRTQGAYEVDCTTTPDEGLTNFISFYLQLIKNSKLMTPLKPKPKKTEKNKYCKKVKATVTRIMEWESGSSVSGNSKQLFMPSEIAGEKDAVQPILHALLYKLSTIQPSSSSESSSSNDTRRKYKLRSDIHTERVIRTNVRDDERGGIAGKKSRFLDYEVGSLRPFHGVLPPHLVRSGIEAKNIARTNKNAEQLHAEARNQIIGLCAKKLLVAFDFGNAGIDASTTGVIITPVYVQFIRVSISGMGTDNAKVALEQSPMAPLVDEKAFSHLVLRKKNIEFLQPCLFPTESSDEDTNSLPKGILQLHHMLHSKDPTFLDEMYFKATYDPNNKSQYVIAEVSDEQIEQKSDKKEVGKLIGSGGFGMAFEANWNDDYVVKASHFGEIKSIKQEIKALYRLSRGNEICQHVPNLKSYGALEYAIRTIKTTTPAFVISPRAMPLDVKTITPSDCSNIFDSIKEALQFIHSNGVFHLDISPRNIMRKSSNEDIYILIDFGCAIVSGEKATGCQGTLAFTHREIHNKGNTIKWKPQQKYDEASFAFTIAAFGSQKLIPWHGFNKRLKCDKETFIFEDRCSVAKKIFNKGEFTKIQKELLNKFVSGA